MKVAVLAPVLRKLSYHTSYGGIERIIISLLNGLAAAGHHIVLYAPTGTDITMTNLEVRYTTSDAIMNNPEGIKQAELSLFKRIVEEQDEFDLIHSHIEPIIARKENGNYFAEIKKPVVVTMHNQTYIPEHIHYYKEHRELHHIHYIFISNKQAMPLDFLPHQTIIYNGINLKRFTFNASPNRDQLLFLGRITPEKGIIQAIQIAKKANKKLLIAAAIDDSQRKYYENEVKPLLDHEQIIYLGEASDQEKNMLLGSSEALLFPIQWHEPFGLVMVEAMATGTPVLATNMGSVSEIIEDGKNGFIISEDNFRDKFVERLSNINQIKRSDCKQSVENRFDEKIMIKQYLDYYQDIL